MTAGGGGVTRTEDHISPPKIQATLEYGQCAVGTHPTGMHSCFISNSKSYFLHIKLLKHLIKGSLVNFICEGQSVQDNQTSPLSIFFGSV